jgi:hypothetical protein
MAKGNEIIVTANDIRGVFYEGLIKTAAKPGTVCMIDVSEGMDDNGNIAQFEVFGYGTDGEMGPLFILLPDSLRGQDAVTAYNAGDWAFFYVPASGEQLNLLHENVSGTADDVAFGDKMIVDNGTGKLKVTTGSPEDEPFVALEALVDPTADQLLHVMVR